MQILLATSNKGKKKEIRAIFAPQGISVITPRDLGKALDVIEDGDTFEANALKKARAWCELTGLPVLADDSGLCVDALDGRPGVYSARYAGAEATDEQNYRKLLKELDGVGDRQARFVCCMALVLPDGRELVAHGRYEGYIGLDPLGEGGFGYDPIFMDPELHLSIAQLTNDEKNSRSHRYHALMAMQVEMIKAGLVSKD